MVRRKNCICYDLALWKGYHMANGPKFIVYRTSHHHSNTPLSSMHHASMSLYICVGIHRQMCSKKWALSLCTDVPSPFGYARNKYWFKWNKNTNQFTSHRNIWIYVWICHSVVFEQVVQFRWSLYCAALATIDCFYDRHEFNEKVPRPYRTVWRWIVRVCFVLYACIELLEFILAAFL